MEVVLPLLFDSLLVMQPPHYRMPNPCELLYPCHALCISSSKKFYNEKHRRMGNGREFVIELEVVDWVTPSDSRQSEAFGREKMLGYASSAVRLTLQE